MCRSRLTALRPTRRALQASAEGLTEGHIAGQFTEPQWLEWVDSALDTAPNISLHQPTAATTYTLSVSRPLTTTVSRVDCTCRRHDRQALCAFNPTAASFAARRSKGASAYWPALSGSLGRASCSTSPLRSPATLCSGTPARFGLRVSCRSGWARATEAADQRTGSNSRTRRHRRCGGKRKRIGGDKDGARNHTCLNT
jgi:hypothetical protein